MNVYDFDKTIYDGDASLDFWKFSIKKQPTLIRYLPYQIFSAVLFKIKILNRKQFKEHFFIFLKSIHSLDLTRFWDQNQDKIKTWYFNQKKPDDLIISASPEFILKEITKRLQVKLISTKMNQRTGKIIGENCRGEEKVKRFRELYKDQQIDQFYSDSESDTPLKKLAVIAYLVKKNQIIDWK